MLARGDCALAGFFSFRFGTVSLCMDCDGVTCTARGERCMLCVCALALVLLVVCSGGGAAPL